MTEAPAPQTIHVVVAGCSGRMGRMLAKAVVETDGMMLSAALERPGHEMLGRDAGTALGFGREFGFPITDDPLEACAQAHALLDFTRPEATLQLAETAAQARLVHVIGTTGFDEAQLAQLALCARHATVIRAGNMSLGVNLLTALTRKAAAILGADWDVEISETHHRWKVDAPSGTALMLGEAAAQGRGVDLAEAADRGRDGITGARREGAIGFVAQRGGDVVGEHDVTFFGMGERISLSHIATDRMLFARGACRAALWGQGRKPGAYDMADVLGLDAL